VTKSETLAILKQAFGLDSVLKKYDSMAPLEGLRESLKYWDRSKEMQEKATSDGRWWEYENEKTLAYVLIGMFCWRLLGHEDYPSLPEAGPEVRMGHPCAVYAARSGLTRSRWWTGPAGCWRGRVGDRAGKVWL
jgi:hypothetical protein